MASATPTLAPTRSPVYGLVTVTGPSGLDLRTSPSLMAADRARRLTNWSLSEPGAWVIRAGYRALSSVIGAGRPQGGARIYLNTATPAAHSTVFTVMGYDGQVYVVSDTGVWSSVLSGLSTVNQMAFVHDRDLVAVMDGSTTPFKSTNGTVWTRMGISSGAIVTLSTLSTGGLSSGEYEIGYTYKDRDLAFESNGGSPSTITLTASSGAIKAVIPNSTDPQVDAVVVYARKVTASETIRRKISSQAVSTTANSTVIVTSTAWTTAAEEPSDHDVPPILTFGCVWKHRWWARSATVTNRIHFSQLFMPQAWPALYYLDVPFERGDAVTALMPLGNALIVFGTTRNFIISGETSLDFDVRPAVSAHDGAVGFRAVAQTEAGVVHAGPSGVYLFDGQTDRLLSDDIAPGWQDLVTNSVAADLASVAVAYHAQAKEVRIAVPRKYPSGTWGEWVLDLARSAIEGRPCWSDTDRTIGGYLPWQGPETVTGNQGRFFSWHSSSAQVNEEATGTSANGANLTAQYEGPGLTLGAFRGRWIDLRFEYEPHGGACSMEPVIDGVSQGTQAVSIGSGLAIYNVDVYGTAVYSGTGRTGRRQAYRILPLSADGRTCVLKLTYTGQETFRLFAYTAGMVPDVVPRSFTE